MTADEVTGNVALLLKIDSVANRIIEYLQS